MIRKWCAGLFGGADGGREAFCGQTDRRDPVRGPHALPQRLCLELAIYLLRPHIGQRRPIQLEL